MPTSTFLFSFLFGTLHAAVFYAETCIDFLIRPVSFLLPTKTNTEATAKGTIASLREARIIWKQYGSPSLSTRLLTIMASSGPSWTGSLTGAGKSTTPYRDRRRTYPWLMHLTAKLEAVTRLLEKLTTDLEKKDLTTGR